jgi:Zn-finger nucleic acid-binding protein
MSKFTFACPQCSQKLRTDSERIAMEITCPGCHRVFIPANEGQSIQEKAAPESESIRQAEKFQSAATSLRQLAVMAIVVFFICIGAAIFCAFTENPLAVGCVWISAAPLSLSILAWFASQIMAIRGQLFKIEEGNAGRMT